MRRTMLALLFVLFGLASTPPAPARQDRAASKVGASENSTFIKVKYNARGKLRSVANMNDSMKKDFTCQIQTYVGTLAALKYDEAETDPYAIIVQLKNGKRLFIGLDENLYQDLSEADRSNLKSALVKGRRVRVKAFACGASGRGDLQSSSIEFL